MIELSLASDRLTDLEFATNGIVARIDRFNRLRAGTLQWFDGVSGYFASYDWGAAVPAAVDCDGLPIDKLTIT